MQTFLFVVMTRQRSSADKMVAPSWSNLHNGSRTRTLTTSGFKFGLSCSERPYMYHATTVLLHHVHVHDVAVIFNASPLHQGKYHGMWCNTW